MSFLETVQEPDLVTLLVSHLAEIQIDHTCHPLSHFHKDTFDLQTHKESSPNCTSVGLSFFSCTQTTVLQLKNPCSCCHKRGFKNCSQDIKTANYLSYYSFCLFESTSLNISELSQRPCLWLLDMRLISGVTFII